MRMFHSRCENDFQIRILRILDSYILMNGKDISEFMESLFLLFRNLRRFRGGDRPGK